MDNDDLGSKTKTPVEIHYPKKIFKSKESLPKSVRPIQDLLEQDIRETAGKPFGRGWKSLGEVVLNNKSNAMHCHLSRKFVAVWQIVVEKVRIVCRFVYVGTREKAPY